MELRVFQIVSASRRREMNLWISGKMFIFSEETIVSELSGVGILKLRAEEYKLRLIF